MTKVLLFFLLSFFLFLAPVEPAKILLFHPSPSRSHLILTTTLAKALASKGHDVTAAISFSMGGDAPNYREIVSPIPGFDEEMKKIFIQGQAKPDPRMFLMITSTANDSYHATVSNPEIQRIMREETFDLVLFGFFFANFQYGIAAHFKCPYVVLTPAGTVKSTNDLVGEHLLPATVPQVFLDYVEPMSFKQRLKNTLMGLFEFAFTTFLEYQSRLVYEYYFPSPPFPTYEEMLKNCSLVFVNKHFSQGTVRPYLPNTVEIGGIQVGRDTKPLPERIQKWLDGATDGAVLLTFGSNVPISQLPEERLDGIFRVLGGLKERVVLKWESEDTSRLPKNVLAENWLPQDAILAHPNVKLFITHCGAGGVFESKYHKVPIVGLPFFADQHGNVERVEKEGWGIKADWIDFNETEFRDAVHEVLHNPKYKNRVIELSNLYTDRLAKPVDTAIYWVEYVIRHRGAPHLQYQGKELNVLQKASLDVIAVIVAILYIFGKILGLIFKTVKSLICPPKSRSKIKKN